LKQAWQRASRRFLKDGARSSLPQYRHTSFSAAGDGRGEALTVVAARAVFGLAPTAGFFAGVTDLRLESTDVLGTGSVSVFM
jgi:hypothetical protein